MIDEFGPQPESIESQTLQSLKRRRDALIADVKERLGEDAADDLWENYIVEQGAKLRDKYPNHSELEAFYFFGGSPKKTMPFKDFDGDDSVRVYLDKLENTWYAKIREQS